MTNAHEDPARDPRLSAAWREHSSELPPAQLDAAILAAAHRAVGSAPQSAGADERGNAAPARAATRPQRWWMPLAAAATIGAVALGILQTAPPDQLDVAPSSSEPRATDETRAISPPESSSAPSREKAILAPEVAPSVEPFPAAKKQDAKERKDSSLSERGAAVAPANAPREAPPLAAASPAMPAAPAGAPAPSVSGNVTAQRTETDAAQSRPAVAAAPQPFPAEKKNEVADAIAPEQQSRDAFAQQKQRAAEAPAPARMAAASDESRQRGTAALPSAPAADVAASPSPPAAAAGAASSPPSAAALSKTASGAAPASARIIDIDAAIVRIRRLHAEGKLVDAAKELNALRAAVADADARLPPELRAWAATVRQ